MALLSVGVYEAPAEHGAISDLIRRHSANPRDVRDEALDGVGVGNAGRLLDLGCGFGFMAEALARRARPGTEIVGVDVNSANGGPFIRRMESFGCRGRFIAAELPTRLPYPNRCFDGVTASFSLSFFVGILPEVTRVLKRDGFFVALTHCEQSLQSLLDLLGLPAGDSPQVLKLHEFSAETGFARLLEAFDTIERRDYANALIFRPADLGDLMAYVRFKLPLVRRETDVGDDVPPEIAERIAGRLEREGRLAFRKDDAAFVCHGPRPP